jgi:transcription elongation GreA/GreB family factor
VSKAFTNEDALTPDEPDALPRRDGPAPITAAGYARLQGELAELTGADPAGRSEIAARRARVLAHVLASVYVVEPLLADGRVGFGTRVTVEDGDGRRTSYELVGPDEVDVAARKISIASPVAQTLLGKRAGDQVILRRPKGDVTVTVHSVTSSADRTDQGGDRGSSPTSHGAPG